MNLSIDKIMLVAIAIPMLALLFVGYISYENTIQFIQRKSSTLKHPGKSGYPTMSVAG